MPMNPGTKLGPYEIQSLLGAGGMGEVYRAHDSRLNRTVAVKILPASFSADRERLQRFAQEARAAAALNHPNILSIFDIGEERGAPYVVSELLEGQTLREKLRTGPLQSRRVIDYALQVARGLAAAHEKGIVHRDLKPENLFITTDGRVKILDFGLAKLTRPETTGDGGDAPTVQVATETGLVMGTAGYMSPEQVRGKATDHRSDIFSFGAILYEMISGRRAFHGESAADTMSAILKEEVPELSETGRSIPAGLERIVHHCLEKHPLQRFQSAGDLAFDLEALTGVSAAGKSGTQKALPATEAGFPRAAIFAAGAIVLALAMLGLGWWLGHGKAAVTPPEYQQITFRTGSIGEARFTPDGSIVYSAAWDGSEQQLYMARTDENGARDLGLKNAELLSISKTGELAIRVNTSFYTGYARSGTLARVPLSGGTPREVLDNVQDAEWSAQGDTMAVVRYVPETRHWRLEYPIGHVLLDGINWISQPRISPDGKWIAFGDHENPVGDDEGSLAIIDMQGHEKKLQSGFVSLEGIEWSPDGHEIWYTATRTGSANNLHSVTLDGKDRRVVNVPGGIWLEDMRNGQALAISHRERVGIRGMPPGGKQEIELGWFGWSNVRAISRDGTKIVFEEEGEGGGPNYTVFLRDTDGSPPVKIGEGIGLAISPDNKWVVTRPANGGYLSLVPTGAGETKQLTHDNIAYSFAVTYLPDGKHLLATGIEPGHGGRDYLIDLNDGSSKPFTPEGITGAELSPDGRQIAVHGPDGKIGVWPMDGSGFRPIPNLDSKYYTTGWTPDGTSLFVASNQAQQGNVKVYQVNVSTGKMDYWKNFGEQLAGGVGTGAPQFSADGRAYVYGYGQVLSEAYVVKGLK
jgi:eukaryotic-like serine/threonine-protein kinase